MKPIIKRCIVSLHYFCDCTYFHTYLLIPCKMLPNVNCKFLRSYSYKIAHILSGVIAHYGPCKTLLKKGKTEPSFLMGEAMGLLIYNEKNMPCLYFKVRSISIVRYTFSYCHFDFFSIYASLRVQKSFNCTCPGFELVTPLIDNETCVLNR